MKIFDKNYFPVPPVKIEYTDISENDFKLKMESHQKNLKESFNDSKKIESEIFRKLSQISMNKILAMLLFIPKKQYQFQSLICLHMLRLTACYNISKARLILLFAKQRNLY